MFDISKKQLLQFSDVDLRELVARLCEAEIKRAGEPVSALRWGGAQTAPDGGLDVECRLENYEFKGDYVPCPRTGIQVKKSKMPRGKIAKEMSPKGVLRPIFSELARHNGCYIIISLDDDPTGPQLDNRKKAMQAQIEAIRSQGDLRMKFYGLSDLANWLRQHPDVQLWAREKLGLVLNGWRPFGRWSTTPPGVDDDLIRNAGVAITLPERGRDKLDIVQGIDGIRELIRTSEKTLRIVGLSGVGKSRIVQALFEASVGNKALDKSLAIYADLGEEPMPSARQVIEALSAKGCRAIVVLDNCAPETHNFLAASASAAPDIDLVTVEYDIREDRPEATNVVRIEAEGTEITETLVKRRYPELSQVNARRIAEFSGGNARLALALADAVSEKESLSGFSDAQLFDRLFYQRGAPDTDFLKATEVLALVYSFSISNDEDGVDELATLAGLLGQDRRTLHRATQTLVDRQLAQKRGNWRAVLPHAVSNRLAAAALRNIPFHDILRAFRGLPNTRLLKSFGKRLGYLHGHPVSREIVKSWISSGGLLHDIGHLNEDGLQLLLNVAPVAPEDVLSALEAQDTGETTETFFSRKNSRFSRFVNLLAKIAYDPNLFKRSVTLLAKFALTEREGENNDSIRDSLFGMFSLYLSGTEADPDVREKVARGFLLSKDRNKQRLGLGMLEAALQSRLFSSRSTFEFGARPRSYGYHPQTHEEVEQWFARFVALAQEMATGEDVELSDRARHLLTNELRGLWRLSGLRAALAALAKVLNHQRPWLEGWQAVRLIKYYDYRKADGHEIPEGGELIDELDKALRPSRLSDEVRTYVLSADHKQFALNEEFDWDDDQKLEKSNNRAAARARDLGEVVADKPQVMDELSQDLFPAQNGYLIEFGQGLASKSDDRQALWERLIEWLELAGDRARNCGVLNGVLEVIHERDEPLARRILDEAVQNCILRKFIVSLQVSVPLDPTGVERLLRSLDFEDTPLRQFGTIAWHRPLDALSEADIRELMLKILDKPDGAEVVLDGLSKRLHVLKDDKSTLGPDLKRVGLVASAALLRQTADYHDSGMMDHNLSEVLKSCMDEAEYPEETNNVFGAFFDRLKASHGYVGRIKQAVSVLAEKGTFRFLEGIFFDPAIEDYHRVGVFKERQDQTNLLSNVSWQRQSVRVTATRECQGESSRDRFGYLVMGP